MVINEAISAFEIYLLTERRVAQNTVLGYLSDLRQLESYLLRKKIVNFAEIDAELLKSFLKNLRSNNGIGAHSLARKISALKMFFKFLEQRYHLSNLAIGLIFPKLPHKLPQFLSEAEVEHLLQVAAQDSSDLGIRNRTMLLLLYVTGMRVTELTELRVQSIQFDEGLISVHGKGDKQRLVPVSPEVLQLIRHEYLANVYPRLTNGKVTEYLFPTIYGGQIQNITRQSFWLILKELAQLAGIDRPLSPHQLRHSLATHLLRKGANLRLLQTLLGHERLATVQIYTHVDLEYLRQIYDQHHPRS